MPATETSTGPVQLAPHVRACRIDDQVILLDLTQDKYLGIGGASLAGLARTIRGWPDDPSSTDMETRASTAAALVNRLVQQRMLTPYDDFRAAAPSLDPASCSFEPQLAQTAWMCQWRSLSNLCLSAWIASRWLKRCSLGEIADAVVRLRQRHHATSECSTEALQLAVSSYSRLRPFVFTSQDRCLHDSLTLVHFLAHRRLFPTWVIGVRTRPFGAHSWVQSGETVLNDVHERVSAFTPILIV